MRYPKMKPCPKCGSAAYLDVHKYDNGWIHVECDNGFNTANHCGYLGPGEGSVWQAIASHNVRSCSGPSNPRAATVPAAGSLSTQRGSEPQQEEGEER